MHPRNIYRLAPDFVSLAQVYPALEPHLTDTPSGASIDFMNDTSQRRLTEALLHRDFNLNILIPDDRLCPPVPNRLNYILWIEDILIATRLPEPSSTDRTLLGVDIGTGASAIYPLLGCRLNSSWNFIATDVDERSLSYARVNVRNNDLVDRITIVPSHRSGQILRHVLGGSKDLPGTIPSIATCDFTMCNPPFYSSKEDVQRSAGTKEFQPNAVCTGADVEMITPGGEGTFVGKMVLESLESQTQCRWYTSMLGKLSSLTEVVTLLRAHNVDNYAVTEFVQGQTRRWAVAWSFGDVHLPDTIARIPNPSVQSLMPTRNTLQQICPACTSPTQLSCTVNSIITTIEGICTRAIPPSEPGTSALPNVDVLVTAAHDTWSRAARRRRAREAEMQIEAESSATMVCRVTCVAPELACRSRTAKTAASMTLQCSWVKGRHRALFESFSSHLSRKVMAALSANTT